MFKTSKNQILNNIIIEEKKKNDRARYIIYIIYNLHSVFFIKLPR